MGTISVSLIGLVSLPSWGLFGFQIGNYSISVDVKFDQIWKNLQAKLRQSLNQELANLPSLNDLGVLGIPDPFEIRKELEVIEGHEGWDEQNEFDRILAEILASETLSKAGQDNIKNTGDAIKQQVNEIGLDADLAQAEVITQNVLKHMARQTKKQARDCFFEYWSFFGGHDQFDQYPLPSN
ncbi:hypothetical protein VB715_21730 [Crocosphaera sp. UHCC 0190]|uniref:hypothetical protein n=1 Tax=Crocosphaera sp. UHCC 0190 TaxID=3110246 RepID=UPI002B211B6A|nr:hypothetical protein [Crocosphaera sp. UHCC 0190]MEA5512394.1 hypothetical protein [Crocosphaera sp. UHCC 0190]